jgi:sulfate adenylyltransferase subunit 1
VLPSGLTSKIASINAYENDVEEAFAGMSVAITLEDDIDISRGDMIVKVNNVPKSTQDITAMICWLNSAKAVPRAKYVLKHTSNEQKAVIKEVLYKVNIDTFKRIEDDKELNMNDICKVNLRITAPIMADAYDVNRETGSFILIDEHTNETVAAGMIV